MLGCLAAAMYLAVPVGAAFAVEKLLAQLDRLVEAGNTIVIVEHDMRVVAGSDWVIDMGAGAGDEGGKIVVAGTPEKVAFAPRSRTAAYLKTFMREGDRPISC